MENPEALFQLRYKEFVLRSRKALAECSHLDANRLHQRILSERQALEASALKDGVKPERLLKLREEVLSSLKGIGAS